MTPDSCIHDSRDIQYIHCSEVGLCEWVCGGGCGGVEVWCGGSVLVGDDCLSRSWGRSGVDISVSGGRGGVLGGKYCAVGVRWVLE